MSQVLVVEDYDDARTMVEMILQDAGYRVLLAADGQQALDLLETETPDVMLLDLLMPRKTGIEVLHESVTWKHSSNGRYVSVRIAFRADSREQYDAAHAALRAHPEVKWTL